jgi:NTP pyrophosphatase (non-canonical NTP hydrolase)
MRGEVQIEAAALEAKKAAERNAHKGDWRRSPLKNLVIKLEEEVDEYYNALVSGDVRQIREELGDVIWTATMIADHGLMLELVEGGE